MKLGMRSDLTQAQRDDAKSPSDLYCALEYCYRHHDQTVHLARFVYALESLGHRRYGHRAVEQLREFSIPKPTEFNPAAYMGSDELETFKFHQLLVDILVHLKEEHNMSRLLVKYFTENHLDRTNPRRIETLCSLFTLLLDRGVITKDNPHALVKGLRKVGANNSATCIYNSPAKSMQKRFV